MCVYKKGARNCVSVTSKCRGLEVCQHGRGNEGELRIHVVEMIPRVKGTVQCRVVNLWISQHAQQAGLWSDKGTLGTSSDGLVKKAYGRGAGKSLSLFAQSSDPIFLVLYAGSPPRRLVGCVRHANHSLPINPQIIDKSVIGSQPYECTRLIIHPAM